jgi:SAM-dependent methyltransferase
MQLQAEQALLWSPVVANCRMNRERGITGVNSYEKELKIDIFALLQAKARQQETVRWMDVCCGSGKALVEATVALHSQGVTNVALEGWDLAGLFVTPPTSFPNLQLVNDAMTNWHPPHTYDLITCVHGLHYIGDKLDLVQRCISYLAPTGKFIANLDLTSIKKPDGSSWDHQLRKAFKKEGIHYHARQRLLSCEGLRHFTIPFDYLGADDQAGKNYTGQEAVDSYYQ